MMRRIIPRALVLSVLRITGIAVLMLMANVGVTSSSSTLFHAYNRICISIYDLTADRVFFAPRRSRCSSSQKYRAQDKKDN